ncbi:MAG TPA: hypothetical protein DCW52_10730 [Gammaproteobacteria bacterium]|nr:hypothetical protein [Gammaproteobacteria bacterium]
MCTLTWFTHDEGYELFFNRDESVLRKRALLPNISEQEGVSYIAPTDADEGGTWIATNQKGYTICLLNHYQFEQIKTYKDWISRGKLVRDFADTDSLAQAQARFYAMDLHDYRAFRMFIIGPAGGNRLMVWDGHAQRVELDVAQPKSSSSVDAQHVKALRKTNFQDLQLPSSSNTNDFIKFHRSHFPRASKESVCMHRAEAQTVSLSHVSVCRNKTSFAYMDGPPCQSEFGEAVSLKIVGDVAPITNVAMVPETHS